MTADYRLRRIAAGVALALAGGLTLAASAPAAAAPTRLAPAVHAPAAGLARPVSAHGIAGWREIRSYTEPTLTAGEGVATVTPRRGRPYELYRGFGSISLSLALQGWQHIGDPDSARGYIFDDYQWYSSSGTSKMYLVTTPSGTAYQYVHTLVPGELYNNSFVSISPDTRWMVSGEWNTMTHLQIYPTPILNRTTARAGGTLPLAGYIELDHPVNDIQGCDFVTARRLVCESDDSTETLFSNPKPLLEVILAAPLRGHDVTGHVIDLGSIPQRSACTGTFEAEGDDYDVATGVLRVSIIQPDTCAVNTTFYEYKRA